MMRLEIQNRPEGELFGRRLRFASCLFEVVFLRVDARLSGTSLTRSSGGSVVHDNAMCPG
jgi:hypothetical protein